ncbi:hypothetical protein [Burkholderia gladioli]|uniref:hypothetical protein n=1 Tax=Burkholderia gladioli TaxID=28095 RepID=UPI001C230232|nr:hypothetical protein [Burkholderia gladioli]MBU9174020.1 hypothetical protein [Burkholderia gladioli]
MTNNTAADLDRDIAHLIDSSENGIARVPRETLVRLRELFALQHSPIRDEQREVARKRVAAFMDAYSILRGADQEKIHSINFTPLLVADLRALLTSPRAALPMTDDARECLMDVVSHHDNIVAGFAAQRNAATEADDSGDIAYWNHEINVAHRMQEQAKRALDAAPAAPVAELSEDDAANLITIDRRDLYGFVRGSIKRALEDASHGAAESHESMSAVDCWSEAHTRTIEIFDSMKIAGIGEVQSAAQAVAADGEAGQLTQEVIDFCWNGYKTGQISADHTAKEVFTEVIQSLAAWVAKRAAVSPATAEPRECCNADCGWKGDVAETITMKHGFPAALCPRCHEVTECGEKSAKADERAAFEIAMQEPLRKLVGDAAASMARYGDAYDSDFVDAAWLAWQVARASQAAAPARIEALRKGLFEARDAMHVISGWSALDAAKVGCVKSWIEDANRVLNGQRDAAPTDAAENVEPSGYAHRYPSGNGTVIRFNDGREVNGCRPIDSVPYWLGAQGGKGGEA